MLSFIITLNVFLAGIYEKPAFLRTDVYFDFAKVKEFDVEGANLWLLYLMITILSFMKEEFCLTISAKEKTSYKISFSNWLSLTWTDFSAIIRTNIKIKSV